MNSAIQKKIRLKCRYENEIRIVIISYETTFQQLKKRLSADFGFDVTLKYDDLEGDLITLSSQNDLDVLLSEDIDTVNVIVTENLLPNVHGKKNSNRVTSIWSGNSSLDWAKNSSGNLTHSLNNNPNSNAHCPSPITSSSSAAAHLQPLRPIAKFDRFPVIESTSSPRFMEKPTRWKKGEILGQGAFGVVYLGLNTETGELMAIKQMTLDDISKKEMSALENEINMLRSLRHPNIVRYIGTEVTPSTLSIFLEYVPGGSLKSLIDKFGKLEESVARSYTRQLLLGLEYLHRNGIAHRDVKGANCLVGNDGAIKLADFGASKQWRPQVAVEQLEVAANDNMLQRGESGSHEVRGTPSWMAPEVIRNDEKHLNWKKADVWSLGCTTIEMTTGKSPWAQFTNPVTVLYHIACSDTLPEYPETPSVELLTFLNSCLQRDPLKRPDITSLLLHPFVANVNYLNSGNGSGGGYGYRPSTVSTTPSMGDWDRESLSSTWKTSTSRSVLGNVGRGEPTQGGQSFIPERDPVPDIPPSILSQQLSSTGAKHSPRYRDEPPHEMKNPPRYIHEEIHPPVGNPDLDLEATAPRNVVENALRSYTRDSSLSPFSAVEKIPNNDAHSLENSLETSDLEDSSNTFESSRILTQASSDDDNAIPLIPYTKVSTAAARRRGRIGNQNTNHHHSPTDDIPGIPEDTEISTSKSKEYQQHIAPPLLSAKDEIIYSAETLFTAEPPIERKKSKDRTEKISSTKASEREKNSSKSRKKVEKLVPVTSYPNGSSSSALRCEDPLTPSRRTANVISISSPINIESPKSSSRKGQSTKNRLEVLESESNTSKIGRRPYDYTPSLSNNEMPISVNKSAKGTPRTLGSMNESLMKSWKSDKSGGVQIEDEIENQKELSDRFFSLRSDEIQDESEVYEDIQNHIYSEDDIPAAELSDDCELLENSVTHLSDDDFTTDDYTRESSLPTASDDWGISQGVNGKTVLEMSVLNEETKQISINDDSSSKGSNSDRFSQEQWAGASTKSKKLTNTENPRPMTISPSMPSLDISRSKIEGYTLVGHSLTSQALGTPKTDIRSNKQSGSISKTSSSKHLHRGAGTATIRRNLEVSGDSIDLRHSGANTANSLSRKPRDSLDVTSIGEMQSLAPYCLGDEVGNLEDSLNSISNPSLNPVCEMLDEHTASVTKLRLNSSKRLLFSASFDGTIRIWSSKSSEIDSQTTTMPTTNSKLVLDVTSFTKESTNTSGTLTRKPSGNKNAATTPTRPIRTTGLWVDETCDTIWGGYSDGVVRVWVSDGRPMRALKGHEDLITCVEGCETAVSSALGSPHVTSTGSLDKSVRVWDIRAKRAQVALFKGHNDSILSMKWIDGGRSLVTASKDRSIKIWDFRSGRLRVSLDKHFGSVNVIKSIPNQTGPQFQDHGFPSFISGARDGMINSWMSDGNCLASQGAHRNSVNCMSEIQSLENNSDPSVIDNPNLITAGADNLVKIWDIKKLRLLSEFNCANVVKVAWFHSSVIAGTSTGQMTLWENIPSSDSTTTTTPGVTTTAGTGSSNTSTNWTCRELSSHTQMCTDIVSNKYCVISSSKSGQIYRWSTQ